MQVHVNGIWIISTLTLHDVWIKISVLHAEYYECTIERRTIQGRRDTHKGSNGHHSGIFELPYIIIMFRQLVWSLAHKKWTCSASERVIGWIIVRGRNVWCKRLILRICLSTKLPPYHLVPPRWALGQRRHCMMLTYLAFSFDAREVLGDFAVIRAHVSVSNCDVVQF